MCDIPFRSCNRLRFGGHASSLGGKVSGSGLSIGMKPWGSSISSGFRAPGLLLRGWQARVLRAG